MKAPSSRRPAHASSPAAPNGDNRNQAGAPEDVSGRTAVSDGSGQVWLAALLFLVVAGVFLPAVTHDFITYDDPAYVTKNAHVTGGLSWANVRWAFQSTAASNWHPLTWISHMADCQFYGLQPWGHHLTSVLLHALNAVLLFIALRKLTGALWRSLFVAALFGLHPLHVESVAWVAERKDVLSTAFMMLTLWAYACRAELVRSRAPGAWNYYALALLFFALGLMSKPMLVTLPCVLLLLDFWPLNRWVGASTAARWALVGEKLPFFAFSAAASAVTLFAQRAGKTVGSVEDYTWPVRLSNALVSYGRYLGKSFVPAKLAVFYPYFAEPPPLWATLLAAGLLVGITVAAWALFRRQPCLLVGWLWFVGTLVPVIGLVQVGGQSMADRYTYVPLIGVFIMMAWAAGDLTASWPHRRLVLGCLAGAVLTGSATLTVRQLSFWKNSVTLFRHTLAVTENNWVAHANLFTSLAKTSPAEARTELQSTMAILAAFAEKYDQRGIKLAQEPGHAAEAIKEFRTAVRIMQDLAAPHFNLGLVLAQAPGTRPEAIAEFRTTLRLRPDFADAHYSLGLLLSEIPGRENEAIAEYEQAIRFAPGAYQAHFNLGMILAEIPARRGEALAHFQAALAAKTDLDQAREMIRRLQATSP